MDARLLRVSLLLATVWVLGTNYSRAANYAAAPGVAAVAGNSCQSTHFLVTAPTPAFARQVCEAAEHFRRALAIEWLGTELPPWQDICPIQVLVGPQLGAGGATTFTFIDGRPGRWHMEIQGSPERILDSVLPHEITHTIFATHFGCPLPRWADEGAATSVEHVSERTKQDQLLIQFLTSNRGIAFNHMFAMREYPPDILPLYSQGYSVARYLIAQGGRRKYVDYVYDGLRWNNWTAATQKHYGLRSLSELQVTWLDWVRKGSPDIQAPPAASLASTKVPSDRAPSTATTPVTRPPTDSLAAADDASGLVPLPTRVSPRPPTMPLVSAGLSAADTPSAGNAAESWYTRQRDLALQPPGAATTDLRPMTPAHTLQPGARALGAPTPAGSLESGVSRAIQPGTWLR